MLGAFALIISGLMAACGGQFSAVVPSTTPVASKVAPSAIPEPVAALQTQASPTPEPTIPPVAIPPEDTPTPLVDATAAPQPEPAMPTPTPVQEAAPRPASPPVATVTPPAPVPTATPFVYSLPPVDRDLFNLALRLRSDEDIPNSRVVATSAEPLEVGYQDTFLITSLVDGKSRSITATVQVVSEHAYWYVDDNLDTSVHDLQTAAQIYEESVHPIVIGAFGDIWNPGVDGDPRLNILHATLKGAAGYYGSKDEFPRQVHPSSNEREIIYMDARNLKPGSDLYMGILAHELQHAVNWNQDIGEEAWVNEGISEFATNLAGYEAQSPSSFLRRPQVQLNWWPDEIQSSFPHYGASLLFFTYLSEHYGGPEGMGQLVREPLDGVDGVNAYLSQYDTTFTEVFKDWVAANFLDASEGLYGYPETDVDLQNVAKVSAGDPFKKRQPQFSAQYYDLSNLGSTVNLSFQGATMTLRLGEGCHGGTLCWWGGMSDSLDATLTRNFDLSGLDMATLEYDVWYDIERGWDYAYVEISKDGGRTWNILRTPHTTTYNPSGNGYGHGYTGSSEAWIHEIVDLTPYVGGEVLIRFEYVTDDAAYLDGLVLDNIAIPELGFLDDTEYSKGWEAQGFTRTSGMLPQLFAVQLMEIFKDNTFLVTPMVLDEGNFGELVITGVGANVKQAVLVVSPITIGTRHNATFELTVTGY